MVGLAAGLAYRALFDPAGENNLANFLRSAAHGGSVGLTAWAVQTVFDSRIRSRLGAALSQLPLAAEIAIRALAMTAVGILLQFILFAAPLRLHWLTQEWLVTTLPRIVAIGFGISFVTVAICLSSGGPAPPRNENSSRSRSALDHGTRLLCRGPVKR